MNIVIQCAARKRSDAGHMRRRDGKPVKLVANPALAPSASDTIYAHPDDQAENGRTWRDLLLDYNQSPENNPLGLRRAFDLYENPIYERLVAKFGIDNVFILSAGWGLIPASFLTPDYNITFNTRADKVHHRHKKDHYEDLHLLPPDSDARVIFLGGKDYVPLFLKLTSEAHGHRIVFYYKSPKKSSDNPPDAPGCKTQHYITMKSTNWQYECAHALIEGTCIPVTI
ncbi:MAG: hypothetical protein HO274_12305 [Ferrovum myxofaciens]|uniref:hypothetical protein n=1 Tax=Ferrovum myxofaciens TaxID=416213 RepID=UPI002353B9D1|nr:hypothetical protein [Ferrovum myxofaciens]QKE41994.1 MAG: hypothetical protein HO274_12305 [Ferrovum myxofaciens]